MFGLVQERRSLRRNSKKICHSTAREEPKEKIKCLKNTRRSLSNSLPKTSKKVAVVKKRKVKKHPKNSKQTILKSKVICKKSLKNYKIGKSQKEEKPISFVKMTQINYSLCKIDFNFPVKARRKSKLLDRKSLTDSANSKNKVHQRKSVQYKSISNLSLIEKEDLSNGYALRSRISDFVRATHSNSSFLTPAVHTPFQKKRFQKYIGKRNPTRISVEPKQQKLVNRKMSSSSPSTSGLERKTRSNSCTAHEPLQEKHCSQGHMGRRKSIKISAPKQQRLEKLELPFSSPVSKYKQNKKGTKVSKSDDDSILSNKEVRSVLEGEDIKIQQKSHQRKSSRNLCKEKENIERPSQKNSKKISTDDILTTPASRPSTLRNSMKGSTPKLNLKPSKRKLDNLDIEIKVTSETVLYGKTRKKSKGCKLDLEDSTRSSTSRKSGRKNLSSIKVVHEPIINTHKRDTLTDDSLKKNRTKTMSDDENSPFYYKRQSGANDMKLKPVKAHQADGSKSNKKTSVPMKNIEYKKDSLTSESNAKQNSTQRKTKFAPVRCGSANKNKTSNKKLRRNSTNSLQTKQTIANFARKQKNEGINASVENIQSKDSLLGSSYSKQTRTKRKIKRDENSLSAHKKRRVKSLEITKTKSLEKLIPIHSTPYTKKVASSSKSMFSKIPNPSTPKWPIDSLTTLATSSECGMTPYFSRQKIRSMPVTNRFVKKVVVKKRKAHSYSKEKSTPDALKTKIPAKCTLKHQRKMINVLNEKNIGYEDDIFESNKFAPLKTFQLGDESDNSSVNIATPKFDFILTPALPKKTPRFKDCISPSELMLARKNAEEYLYRRNKKKKTIDEAAISAIKKNRSKRNSYQDVPEKKKLDFEEAMNKLIEVKKNLEQDDGDEEDSYFSDVSD